MYWLVRSLVRSTPTRNFPRPALIADRHPHHHHHNLSRMPKSTEPAHYLPVPLKSKSTSLLLRITSSPTSFPITLVATDGSVPFSAKRFLSRPFVPILIVVSKKDVQAGKSGSFDGTDEEWQKIVMDALFSTSAQDITLSASLNKAKDKITVLSLQSGQR